MREGIARAGWFLLAATVLVAASFMLKPYLAEAVARAADPLARALWPGWIERIEARDGDVIAVLRLAAAERAGARAGIVPPAWLAAPALGAAAAFAAAAGLYRRMLAAALAAASGYGLLVIASVLAAPGAAARLAGGEAWPYRMAQAGGRWITRPADGSELAVFRPFFLTEPAEALVGLALGAAVSAAAGFAAAGALAAWRRRRARDRA